MTDKTKEALKLALEALESDPISHAGLVNTKKAITAIREALAEESSGTEQPDMNLNCKSVQARLATSWGYVKAEQPAQPQTDQSVTPEYLEWLDSIQPRHGVGGNEAWNAGVAWAKAQPQQEPVAFYVYKPTLPRGNLGSVSDGDLPWVYDQDPSSGFNARMLVMPITSPPASKPWVGLTDEEVMVIAFDFDVPSLVVRTVESKLKEKNA